MRSLPNNNTTITMPQTSRRRPRAVSFCNDTPVEIPAAATASDGEIDTTIVPSDHLWYTKAELSVIRRAVGNVLIRRVMIGKTKQQPKGNGDDHTIDDPELWGLERHGLERHHTKKTAIKLILLAQNMKECKTDPEFLRNVSLHCSKTAQGLAVEQGMRDACHQQQIYYYDKEEEESSLVEKLVDDCLFDCNIPSSICGCNATTTNNNKNKRSASAISTSFSSLAGDNHARRVRSRVSAA